MEDAEKIELIEHADRKHATLGGSTASRWLNCHGSVSLIRELPDPGSSAASLEGTKAHELAEVAVFDFLANKIDGITDPNARLYTLAETLEADDMQIQSAMDFREKIFEHVFEGSITGKAFGCEQKMTISEKLDMFGFIDFWAVKKNDKAQVIGNVTDYKYGYYRVEAKGNAQLAYYAVGLLDFIESHGKTLDGVQVAIYQPRAGGWSEDFINKKQLLAWKKKFLKAAEDIFVKKSTKLVAGKHCKYCPAQGSCPKFAKQVQDDTRLALIEVKKVVLPEVSQLSLEDISAVLRHSDDLEEFITACKKRAMGEYLSGKVIPGLKVVEGKSRRTWKYDEAELAQSFIARGIKEEDMFVRKLKPLTQMEKIIGKDSVNEYVKMTDPPLILVDETDPRQAVQSSLDLLK